MRGIWLQRLVEIVFIASALACVALAGARVVANLSLHAPLQLVTSGAEQEALDSIWRFAHGQPVYTDPRKIPYTLSCFNELFYATYGAVAGGTLRLFHLDDAWLPTVCRFLTLAIALAGAALFAFALRSAQVVRLRWRIIVPLAILAFFNPLCGFWIVTARPDLGAAVLELAGVAFFFRHLRDGRLRWIVLAALALDAAWAFKQTSVCALAGMALTLLVLRHRHSLLMLITVWLGGALGAVAWLGPVYRHQLYFAQIHSGFGASWALHHFGSALLKMPFIAVALAGVFATWKQERTEPIRRAMGLIFLLTLGFELVFSAKGGAGDYYFIPLGVWSVLWLGMGMDRFQPRWQGGASIAASAMILLEVAAIFAGRCGTIDARDPRQPYEHLAHYLAARPGPVFVQDPYGDLPWISPTSPHFVVAYNNGPDRRAGVAFERDGWQGLIAAGYFSTVVTEAGNSEITDAMLMRYRLVGEEAQWRYFERR
jgi:hypothetical protein